MTALDLELRQSRRRLRWLFAAGFVLTATAGGLAGLAFSRLVTP